MVLQLTVPTTSAWAEISPTNWRQSHNGPEDRPTTFVRVSNWETEKRRDYFPFEVGNPRPFTPLPPKDSL